MSSEFEWPGLISVIASFEYLSVIVCSTVVGSFLAHEVGLYETELATGSELSSQYWSRRRKSRCDHCQVPIRWFHKVPIISWIFLHGRCAFCGDTISYRYPLIEGASVLIGVMTFTLASDFISFLMLYMIGVCLFLIVWIDISTRTIPDFLLFLLITTNGMLLAMQGDGRVAIDGMLAAVIGFWLLESVRLFFLFVRGYEGLGSGDPKLMFALGLLMTPESIIHAVTWAGLLAAIAWVWISVRSRRWDRTYQIAFAPFLIGGALVVTGVGMFYRIWSVA